MGGSSSKPVSSKHTVADSDNRLYYGTSCMQGWRPYMEDFHVAILKMPNYAFPHHCPHPYVCTYSDYPKEAASLISAYLEAAQIDVDEDDDGETPNGHGLVPNGRGAHQILVPSSAPAADLPEAANAADVGRIPITKTGTTVSVTSINSVLEPVREDADMMSPDDIDGPKVISRVTSTYADARNLGLAPPTASDRAVTGKKPKPQRALTNGSIPSHPADDPAFKNIHPPPYVFNSRLFPSELHFSLFAVCDGHRGNRVSHYLSRRLHWRIASTDEFERGDYAEAMKKAVVGLDEELKHAYDTLLVGREPAGSTCITALVTNDQQLYVANTGDSRAVLCSAGEVVPMSFDHKPDMESEKARIEEAGGFVDDGRVLGRLATARAVGDFDFKSNPDRRLDEQIVTAKPDVYHKSLNDDDEFLVMCSDGVFDVLSNASLISFVRSRLAASLTPPRIAEEVLDYCLATNPSVGDVESGAAAGTDNMTCVVVVFLRGRTWEEFVQLVRRRYGGFKSTAQNDDVQEVDLSNLDGSAIALRATPPMIDNPRKRYDAHAAPVSGWQCCGLCGANESAPPRPSMDTGGWAGVTETGRVRATKVEPGSGVVDIGAMKNFGNLVVGQVSEVEMTIRQDPPRI